MSKLVNRKFNDRISNMNIMQKDKIKNPYYAFSDASKTVVTYYTVNDPKTTLDDATKGAWDYVSDNSSVRFDKLLEFPLYGLDKLMPDLEIGEFGLQSSTLEGEAILLPNTIKPTPNDHFIIDYIDKTLMFRVTKVTQNHIENDNLMYKISYSLSNDERYKVIDNQVINTYQCTSMGIEGEYKVLIEKSSFDLANRIQTIIYKLIHWYRDLFYNDRLEAFILFHKCKYLYDEYLTEFIIRNRIISPNATNIHVKHQTNLCRTFSINYEKTFFRYLESLKYDIDYYAIKAVPTLITDLGSTLAKRYNDYHRVEYLIENYSVNYPVLTIMDNDFVCHLENKDYSDIHLGYKNIILKYISNVELDESDIANLELYLPKYDKEAFYNIPILIMILQKTSNSIINNKTFK